jgi:hypothetical protein
MDEDQWEKLEDTKWVIRCHRKKMDRQCNDSTTNNDWQNTIGTPLKPTE